MERGRCEAAGTRGEGSVDRLRSVLFDRVNAERGRSGCVEGRVGRCMVSVDWSGAVE